MDGINIREATSEDKDDVINIADVHHGLDYLEDFYEDLIKDLLSTSYVAVYNDKIIGFITASVVDEGHTVVARAARVSPSVLHQGVYKRLLQHSSRISGASVLAFTTTTMNPAIRSKTFQQKYKLVMALPISRFNFLASHVHLPVNDDVSSATGSLDPLTKDLLQSFFADPKYRYYLFPDDRIVVFGFPFKILVSNIPNIWTREQHSHRVSDVHVEDGVIKGLVSISTIYNSREGTCVCHVNIYGADDSSVRRHLTSHVNYICERTQGNAVFDVYNASVLDTIAIQGMLQEEFKFRNVFSNSLDVTDITKELLYEGPVTSC